MNEAETRASSKAVTLATGRLIGNGKCAQSDNLNSNFQVLQVLR
jgi:hypothetical protein